MPAKAPSSNVNAVEAMGAIAQGIRARRKSLGVSTVVAAHAAGVSRVTWHRMEHGEPSVTLGAYVGALQTLGLRMDLQPMRLVRKRQSAGVLSAAVAVAVDGLPATVPIQQYPQLRQVAWHVKDGFELTPAEALGLYERYRRHLDFAQMEPHERALLAALEKASVGDPDAV